MGSYFRHSIFNQIKSIAFLCGYVKNGNAMSIFFKCRWAFVNHYHYIESVSLESKKQIKGRLRLTHNIFKRIHRPRENPEVQNIKIIMCQSGYFFALKFNNNLI